HDGRRVGRDDARAGRLLRPVVEVEPDGALGREVEADALQRVEADLDRPLLRVRRLERRQPAHVAEVERGRGRLSGRAEAPLEPAVAEALVRGGRAVAGVRKRTLQIAERDALLLLAAAHRIGFAGDRRLERLAVAEQLEPLAVEARREVRLE